MAAILLAILRAFQLLFSIVALGLEVTLAKGQLYGAVPTETGFAAFAGGLGVIAAIIGLIAIYVEPLQRAFNGAIVWILDAIASICFLAAGLILAIALRGAECSSWYSVSKYKMLNCGMTTDIEGKTVPSCDSEGMYQRRCREDKAATVFMFLAFALCVAAGYFGRRHAKQGGRSSFV